MSLEEATCAAWLHDMLKPHVTEVLVCDPRKNALRKSGNKNDRVDARNLANLLRTGLLSRVYHEAAGVRTLKELARSYLAITGDLTLVMYLGSCAVRAAPIHLTCTQVRSSLTSVIGTELSAGTVPKQRERRLSMT